MTKEKVHYNANGVVLGNLWVVEKAWYPARIYGGTNFTLMYSEIKEDFESGALDSGMGFESLEGAMMVIVKLTVIEYKGKEFVNKSSRKMWFGKMNKWNKEGAEEVYMSYE